MLLYKGDTGIGRCKEIANERNVKGIMLRPVWEAIETSKGVYDWSTLDTAVKECASHGKHAFFLVLDREFGGSSSASRCHAPQYVKKLNGGNGCMATKNGGMPRLHVQEVMNAEIGFFQAIAKRYDNHPGFGGAMPEESGPGFGDVSPPAGYSNAAMAEQLVRLYKAAGAAFQKSIFIAQINFLGGQEYVPRLMKGAHDGNAGIGGPDHFPSSCSGGTLSAQTLWYNSYRGAVPGMYQIQGPEMNGGKGTCNYSQLKAEVEDMSGSYVFWLRNTGSGIKWTTDILPGLKSSPPRMNTTCPTNFKEGCSNAEMLANN
jgi:hypothetical protein